MLGLVLVAGGVIVTQFLRSAVDYYCNADEIGVRSGCDADRRLRVQGTVDAGSLSEVDGDTAFTITFNDVTLPVRYDGQPGGIFKECMPVIVHGRLEGDTFMGDDVEVKHDSSYEAANPERIAEAEADAATPARRTADDRGEPQPRARQRRADADAGRDDVRRAVDGVLDPHRQHADAAHSRRGTRGSALAGAVLAVVMMQRALITRDFSLAYVQQVGSTSTPPLYNVAAMWSSLEGSILLWAIVIAGYTAAVAWRFRRRTDDPLVGWALVVMFVVAAFFALVSFGPASPFQNGPPGCPRRAGSEPPAAEPRPRAVPPADPVPGLRRVHGSVRVRHRRARSPAGSARGG